MTIHVNIGEAKTRLSELLMAMKRGERVQIMRAGQPEAELVPAHLAEAMKPANLGDMRRAAFDRAATRFAHLAGSAETIVPPSMTEDDIAARESRIFGPAA